jgi:protein-tyrosine-phosphatase/DNA-binding transcriptional ArsR family regulator
MKTKHAAPKFAALGQATRLDVLRLLAGRGAAGVSAGEIAAGLGQAPSTLSFHLAALEQAGLVSATRQGRSIFYALRVAAIGELLQVLAQTCSPDRPELAEAICRLLPPAPATPAGVAPAFNVLFLCTHNSARSIMAEAILATVGGGRFRAYSAGSAPSRRPLPEVIERLAAFGHDVSDLRSKSWDEFTGPDAPHMDFVITLCDVLDGQVCPEFRGHSVSAAWPFPDPRKFMGR